MIEESNFPKFIHSACLHLKFKHPSQQIESCAFLQAVRKQDGMVCWELAHKQTHFGLIA